MTVIRGHSRPEAGYRTIRPVVYCDATSGTFMPAIIFTALYLYYLLAFGIFNKSSGT